MTDRTDRHCQESLSDAYREMFHRALGGWASQVLCWRASAGRIDWVQPDAMDDHACRDWHKLYQGSVLDD